jgi:sugar/nucleoside kinase (ribokinase family)
MSEAVVAGHLCLDIIPEFVADQGGELSAYLAPGRLTDVGPATLCTGGAVSNAGINLHRLGIGTQLMGKIGDDLLGRAILDVVRSHDPDLAQGMVVVPGEGSSYTLVIDPPGVDRLFLHCPGTNDTFGVEDLRTELLAGVRLFHFGYPPLMARMYAAGGRELAEVFRRAKETGVTTSLDLAMPDGAGPSGQVDWPEILGRTLPYVDVFVPSVEELLFMLQRERFEGLTAQVGAAQVLEALAVDEIVSLGDEALGMGAKVVLLKAGTRGLYLRTAPELSGLGRGEPGDLAAWEDRQLWAPCFRPEVVASTVGTGDVAIAGFLAALLRDGSPALALRVSAATGACCVEVAGALGGVRDWEATLARIDAGWERLPLDLEDAGWVWDAGEGVWQGPGDHGRM